ncbi:MAG: hypothetical protein WA151_03735 [Desulfatirhabdiaceae bacterium]
MRTGISSVGSKSFIEKVKSLLGYRAKGRKVKEGAEGFHLREQADPYGALFGLQKSDIIPENTYPWNISHE